MKNKKYPQVHHDNGEVDVLATQLLGQAIDSREREREDLEAMKKQHEEAVKELSKEVIEGAK